MKRAAPPPSLLDDPFFVAELEKLELPVQVQEVWGGVRWQGDPPPPAEASDGEDPSEDSEHFIVPDARRHVPSSTSTLGSVLVTIAGFLIMMSMGAAAAAVVFHDRVAQILQLLR